MNASKARQKLRRLASRRGKRATVKAKTITATSPEERLANCTESGTALRKTVKVKEGGANCDHGGVRWSLRRLASRRSRRRQKTKYLQPAHSKIQAQPDVDASAHPERKVRPADGSISLPKLRPSIPQAAESSLAVAPNAKPAEADAWDSGNTRNRYANANLRRRAGGRARGKGSKGRSAEVNASADNSDNGDNRDDVGVLHNRVSGFMQARQASVDPQVLLPPRGGGTAVITTPTAARYGAQYRRRLEARALAGARSLCAVSGDSESEDESGAPGSVSAAAAARAALAAITAANSAAVAHDAALASVELLRYSGDEVREEDIQLRRQRAEALKRSEMRAEKQRVADFARMLQEGRFWLSPQKRHFVPILRTDIGQAVDESKNMLSVCEVPTTRGHESGALVNRPPTALAALRVARQQLASVFERHRDPSSGRDYYVNTHTMECSWNPPRHIALVPPQLESQQQEQAQHQRPAGGETKAKLEIDATLTIDRVDTSLIRFSDTWAATKVQSVWRRYVDQKKAQSRCALEWKRLYDTSYGCHYYWNTRTQASSWERPFMFPDPSRIEPDQRNSEVDPTLVLSNKLNGGEVVQFAGNACADAEGVEGEQSVTAFSGAGDAGKIEEADSGALGDSSAVAVTERTALDSQGQQAMRSHVLPRPKRRDLQVTDPRTGQSKSVGWQGVPISSKSVTGVGLEADKNMRGRVQRKKKQRPRCATELVAEAEAEAEATKIATKQETESRRASLKIFGIAQAAYRSYRQSDLSAKHMWRCLKAGDLDSAAEVLLARPVLARLRLGDADTTSAADSVGDITGTRPMDTSHLYHMDATDTRPLPLHYVCACGRFDRPEHLSLLRHLLVTAPETARCVGVIPKLGSEATVMAEASCRQTLMPDHGEGSDSDDSEDNGFGSEVEAASSSGTGKSRRASLVMAFQARQTCRRYNALEATVGQHLAAVLEPHITEELGGDVNGSNSSNKARSAASTAIKLAQMASSVTSAPPVLPLHLLCHNLTVNFDAMWELLLVFINSPDVVEGTFGFTPLHALCLNPSVTSDTVRLLLQFSGDAAQRQCDISGSEHGHARQKGVGGASGRAALMANLRRLRAAAARYDGAFPIHLLSQNYHAEPDMFEALHSNYPQAARSRTKSGATVLHFICSTKLRKRMSKVKKVSSSASDDWRQVEPPALAELIRAACLTQRDPERGEIGAHDSDAAMTDAAAAAAAVIADAARREQKRITDTARHAHFAAADAATDAGRDAAKSQLLALFDQERSKHEKARLAIAQAEAVRAAREAGKPIPAPQPTLKTLVDLRGSVQFFTRMPPTLSPIQLFCSTHAMEIPVHAAREALEVLLRHLPQEAVNYARGGASALQLLCGNRAIEESLLRTLVRAIEAANLAERDKREVQQAQGKMGYVKRDEAAAIAAGRGSVPLDRGAFSTLCSNPRATPSLLKFFLSWQPGVASEREDGQISFEADNPREETARSALHALCANPAVVDHQMLQILLHECPEAVQWREVRTGHTPLHKLCGCAGATHINVSMLLDAFNDAAGMRSVAEKSGRRNGFDNHVGGRSPLHILCCNAEALGRELGLELMKLVLQACPEAALWEDDEGTKPMELLLNTFELHERELEMWQARHEQQAKMAVQKKQKTAKHNSGGQYVRQALPLKDAWLEAKLRHAAGERTFGHREALGATLRQAMEAASQARRALAVEAAEAGEVVLDSDSETEGKLLTSSCDIESLWLRQKYTNVESEAVLIGSGGERGTLVRGKHANRTMLL